MAARDVAVPLLRAERRRWGEDAVKVALALAALVSVATTVGIVVALLFPAIEFFREVRIWDYLTGTDWAPLFEPARFGVVPLIVGTLSVTLWACAVCIPFGLGAAIYLSEYAGSRTRKTLKPLLEILAGIPTVVYGYFALTFVTPLLRDVGLPVEIFNALSAGLVMGVMLIPTVASLSEDAMFAVPADLRAGAGRVDGRLFTSPPSITPEQAGARPAILATVYLGFLIIAFTVPIGVATAIYLEEYASKERWYNRLLEVNIQNLAAVPSIVYGILGLAFLVRGLGLGRVLLAGAMILTLLVLPTVIIAAREAIRAVPDSLRQASWALGATRWQVVWRTVLPAAVPGIATGTILALSRAIGETAPLLLIGALTYISFDPTILGPFTALPIQIYQWIRLPQDEFRVLAAAGIIVLLGILLSLNAVAIVLRNRFQRRW